MTLVEILCILGWAIIAIEGIGAGIVFFRTRKALRKVRASSPPTSVENGSVQVLQFIGGFDPHIRLNLRLLETPRIRIGLPELDWEKHIRWTIAWWP